MAKKCILVFLVCWHEYRVDVFEERSVFGGALFFVPEICVQRNEVRKVLKRNKQNRWYFELLGCSAPRKYLQQTLLTDSGRPSDLKHNFCSASVQGDADERERANRRQRGGCPSGHRGRAAVTVRSETWGTNECLWSMSSGVRWGK